MMKRLSVIVVLMTALSVVGSASWAKDAADGKVKVFVSIDPIAYFVQRVGGPNVDVGVLVGSGQDPHTFDPTPKLIAKLADAKVLFRLGFPFEENLIKKMGSAFKKTEVVDLRKGIKLRAMTEEEAEAEEHEHEHGGKHAEKHEEGHGHGKEAEHSHEKGEMDQHTWLDPRNAKIQAQTIADALIRIDPSRRDQYEKNLKAFQADLDDLNAQLTKALAPVKGKSFFVFHPAYGYFADAYGLKQVPVEVEGKEPTAKQLAGLIASAKKQKVKVIFVEPQFSKKSAEALAKSIGGAVVSLDPLAGDYMKNLKEMGTKLDSALGAEKK